MKLTTNKPSFSARVDISLSKEIMREISPTAQKAFKELKQHAKYDRRHNLSLNIAASKMPLGNREFPVFFYFQRELKRDNTKIIKKITIDARQPNWNDVLSSGEKLIKFYENIAFSTLPPKPKKSLYDRFIVDIVKKYFF